MVARQMYLASLCRKCGGHLEETAHPDNDPDNPESANAYRAHDPVECFQCKVLARAERKYAEHPDAAALIHLTTLEPKRR